MTYFNNKEAKAILIKENINSIGYDMTELSKKNFDFIEGHGTDAIRFCCLDEFLQKQADKIKAIRMLLLMNIETAIDAENFYILNMLEIYKDCTTKK